MKRIGVVNIDTSHPLAFAGYLHKQDRARYVAVYNDSFRGDDEVDSFVKKFGLEKRCQSIEELVQLVDIGFIQSCNWDNHIKEAMPFIRSGKPVFIDKPMVGSLVDCEKIETLAEQGAVILGSSSVRYAEEIEDFLNQPLGKRGEIIALFGTAGVDEFNYAIHIVEALCQLAGAEPVSTNFTGRAVRGGLISETFLVRFANGITATYTTCHGIWQPFELIVMTTKSTFHFRIDTSKLYPALLDRLCLYLETGENTLAPVKQITWAIKAMLAGRISRNQGGGEIELARLSKDDPGFDGAEFQRQYAKAAAKIYL